MSEPFLTIEQAARQLQVHPYTLRRWVREGKIQAVKISRHYRISPDALKPAPAPFVDEAPQPLKGEARRAAIAALKGKYPASTKRSSEEILAAWARACGSMAHLPGNSNDFLKQKRTEIENAQQSLGKLTFVLNPQLFSEKSTFFEKLMEHRFLFDLGRELVLHRSQPCFLNVLKSEVDAFGFDLVLAVGGRSCHVQMKTRSGNTKVYQLSPALWQLPNAFALWMDYDGNTLEPSHYYLMDFSNPHIQQMNGSAATNTKIEIKLHQTQQKLDVKQVADILFP